jgi:hypothetical protein
MSLQDTSLALGMTSSITTHFPVMLNVVKHLKRQDGSYVRNGGNAAFMSLQDTSLKLGMTSCF